MPKHIDAMNIIEISKQNCRAIKHLKIKCIAKQHRMKIITMNNLSNLTTNVTNQKFLMENKRG